MQEHQKEIPGLSQEQAGDTLERVYKARRLPFDRSAYDEIFKKARRGRALRLVVLVLLIVIVTVIVLGLLGFFTTEYIRHVVVQAPPTVSNISPPSAVSAWVEDNEVVLQLEPGENPIDYARISAVRQDTGGAVLVSIDAESGRLRLPCPATDAVFAITVYDTQGASYQILATVTAGG